jgi:hypothetical protein
MRRLLLAAMIALSVVLATFANATADGWPSCC